MPSLFHCVTAPASAGAAIVGEVNHKAMKNPAISFQINGDSDYPISLLQTGRDKFTVTYGLQVKRGLCYADAAMELGCCLMHSAACMSLLDSSEKAA